MDAARALKLTTVSDLEAMDYVSLSTSLELQLIHLSLVRSAQVMSFSDYEFKNLIVKELRRSDAIINRLYVFSFLFLLAS